MPQKPPPLPGSPAKSDKVPSWVWILLVICVIFSITIYGGGYWAFTKANEFLRAEMAKTNPEFEMLSFVGGGKLKVRHKPSGNEFLIDPPSSRSQGRIELLQIATQELKPVPAWIQLKDAVPNAAKNGWDRMGDTGMLIESLEDVFLDHDFVTGVQDDKTITACNAKQLHCVVILYGFLDNQDNRSWYSATFFQAP